MGERCVRSISSPMAYDVRACEFSRKGLSMTGVTGADALRFADRPVVLFDFDGTIADTSRAILRTARKALERRGYDVDALGDLTSLIGPPLFDGFMNLCGVDLDEAVAITNEYRALFNVEVRPEDYPPLPGIPELLCALSERGTRIAVATSRLESMALDMIGALDLPPFEAIVGRLEPGRDTKADCIREALRQLDVDPGSAVMVGDRKHDTQGAHACGVPCIAVYTGTAKPGEHEQAGADTICHGIPELAAALGVSLA